MTEINDFTLLLMFITCWKRHEITSIYFSKLINIVSIRERKIVVLSNATKSATNNFLRLKGHQKHIETMVAAEYKKQRQG